VGYVKSTALENPTVQKQKTTLAQTGQANILTMKEIDPENTLTEKEIHEIEAQAN
jgi:hypothetical protein